MNKGCKTLILWTGPRHSGKTSSAAGLAEAMRRDGSTVGGFLAPSVYREKTLVGFQILDLQTGRRATLARRGPKGSSVVGFGFCERGMQLGRQALQATIASPVDLVVVDEFGPLELDGRGWRSDVESLLRSGSAVLLLVVRSEVVRRVRRLYRAFSLHAVQAADPRALQKVKAVLEADRHGGPGPRLL